MPTMTVNGLRTNVQLVPAGGTETVVFLHGMGTDSLASFYLTLAPPVAAAGIDVISYDLRGHGKTERPERGYTLGDFVADLDDLLRQLGVDRPVHLVGNSFGGTLAYSYAVACPSRVRSIVCIESEPATEVWAEKMSAILAHTVRFLQVEESFDWIEANFSAHHRRLARMAAERITSTKMAEEVPLGPLLTWEQVAAIGCPVLSILGSHGYQADDLEALTSLLPNGELHVFEGQGHSVLVEQHREVRELVLRWIGRHAA
ncbi:MULTISPECIES: alpha/beta fold hydrolase [unclassified Amycolatopsis]|uniref:alpha/beta fold hydrolase n=1 Tax=unclassified Amycolatopsis TaxID=2618356 RepID=UPI002874C5BC|nr:MULTISPECIES: alpha/beta hydrolase [unclassified Amycolatopsis]MDS0132047.1 alpha/beta hydrolase [Amycolatopsis sp. 505]MDS0141215.1 alpha/beta hydrolase [Amycolatopsis sp. CM201R]